MSYSSFAWGMVAGVVFALVVEIAWLAFGYWKERTGGM